MTFRRAVALTSALTFALALVGCGLNPSMLPSRPGATSLKARSATKAAELVAALKAADARLTTMTAVASFWETDGKKSGDHAAAITLAKPGKIRAQITRSTDAMKRGVKLVYLNDGKVRAKLGFIKKTFDYDDPTVTSLRGWRIDQTNYESIVTGILHPQAAVSYRGPATIGGVACELIEVKSPGLLPGASHEIVALDAKRHLPVGLEVYDGAAVVYRLELTDVVVNPSLPKDAFEL